MKHNYTEGPWFFCGPIGAEHAEVRDKDGRRIAVVIGSYPMRISIEDANAHLIATAPELYELLNQFVNNDKPIDIEKAKQVLQKAQGTLSHETLNGNM